MNVDDMNTRDAVHAIYLDWLNNYLTVSKFADDHDMPRAVAEYLIDRGSEIEEEREHTEEEPESVSFIDAVYWGENFNREG